MEFNILDIFKNIGRGKRLTQNNFVLGDIPYVSSTMNNNGVSAFVGNKKNVKIFNNCLTIANSGSVGSTFYHPYSFVASDHVTHLKNKDFNKNIYLFISAILNRLVNKYNFNREIKDKRLKRETVILPVNGKNMPDYAYMNQYIKNIMYLNMVLEK